jgi:prepilin peptidase CpaA
MTVTNEGLALALLFTAAAAAWDLRSGHIPNRLTFAAILTGCALHVAVACLTARAPQPDILTDIGLALARAAFGVLVCGLVPYLLFLREGMGGGDVKLLAGVGALLGPVLGLEVELYAFVAMALFACARLAYDGGLLRVLGHSAALVLNPLLPTERRRAVSPALFSSLKFGPAVFVATAAVALLRFRIG